MLMKQLSIIIPTMWRHKPFVTFLYQLLNYPAVGEVFLINNDVERTPFQELVEHPKLKIKHFPENITVNPSWNYGVAQTNFEYLLILNDDITFDLTALDTVLNFMQQGRFIVNFPHPNDPYTVTGESRLVKYQPGHKLHHIGCMMFIHRRDYIPIPSGLNFDYGDTWMWDYMLARYNENYLLENIFYDTPMSVTNQTLPNRQNIYLKETELVIGSWNYYISWAVAMLRT